MRSNVERAYEYKSLAKTLKRERIEFIRSMTRQLATMARAEKADFVTYLLEMAYVEASDILRDERDGTMDTQSDVKARRAPQAA